MNRTGTYVAFDGQGTTDPTESDIHYCGFDVYRDQSALTCVQDI